MTEKEDLVRRLRDSVAPEKPDLRELETLCHQFVGYFQRSRAITQTALEPVGARCDDGIDVCITDDDGEY